MSWGLKLVLVYVSVCVSLSVKNVMTFVINACCTLQQHQINRGHRVGHYDQQSRLPTDLVTRVDTASNQSMLVNIAALFVGLGTHMCACLQACVVLAPQNDRPGREEGCEGHHPLP